MFYERLLLLCSQNNIRITSLISELQISSGNLSKWKAGGTPKSDTVSKIADYFGVSTDYLLGRTDKKEPGLSPEAELSPAELSLLSLFRKLPPEDQDAVIRVVQAAAGK